MTRARPQSRVVAGRPSRSRRPCPVTRGHTLILRTIAALEVDKASEAELEGRRYSYIVEPAYRWEAWAAPKTPDGRLDHNAAMTGDDLRDFVNGRQQGL